MTDNQQRRQARRQQRGLLRVEAILAAAGAVFADVGYDRATTNLIAARASVSPGSLYQFFPNKEAIAQTYATAATEHLHRVYDAVLAHGVIDLPLEPFVETLIDALVGFNREFPGYLALSIASTISPSLAAALVDLRQGVMERLDTLFAARLPASSEEERRIRGLVTYRVFLAVLPLVLDSDGTDRHAIVHELKTVLIRYWEPMGNHDAAGA